MDHLLSMEKEARKVQRNGSKKRSWESILFSFEGSMKARKPKDSRDDLWKLDNMIGKHVLSESRGWETTRKEDIEARNKLRRAYSECLGTIWRRRTRIPAKSFGELEISNDPKISEWGNPLWEDHSITYEKYDEGRPGELKHLSTRRKRKIEIDSVSSGERKRRSPNQAIGV